MPEGGFQSGIHAREGGNTLVIETGGTIVFGEGSVAARVLRTRVAVAAVNAGATLLAAVAGKAYRVIDCSMIAVGGAATTGTTVDILGTQTASGVKLVAFGQAALTQSALVRAGAAGGVLLADGLSFVANDANTAITIGKTGSSFTVVVSVDVILTYTLE
jgi:hypothetical protein